MNKKELFKLLEKRVIGFNGSKYLDAGKAPSYWAYFRNREKDCCYYRLQLKGNYIRVWRTRYVDAEGQGVNTYMNVFIPALVSGEKPDVLPREEKVLLVKELFRDVEIFIAKFKELTPDLGWYDRD